MARGDTLTVDTLPEKVKRGVAAAEKKSTPSITIELGLPIEEVEKKVIEETLAMTEGDRKKAAEILGISTKTLSNKTRKYEARRRKAPDRPPRSLFRRSESSSSSTAFASSNGRMPRLTHPGPSEY